MSFVIESEAIARYPYEQKNHLAWAHRINYRYVHGDRDLLQVQINFAKESLGAGWQDKTPIQKTGYREDIE